MKDILQYQEAATRTAPNRTDNYINFSLGLAGEAGEVGDIIKKVAFQGHSLDKAKLKYELGDCMWYIVNLAKELDIDMEEVLDLNIAKLYARYPEGFNASKSINRKV